MSGLFHSFKRTSPPSQEEVLGISFWSLYNESGKAPRERAVILCLSLAFRAVNFFTKFRKRYCFFLHKVYTRDEHESFIMLNIFRTNLRDSHDIMGGKDER